MLFSMVVCLFCLSCRQYTTNYHRLIFFPFSLVLYLVSRTYTMFLHSRCKHSLQDKINITVGDFYKYHRVVRDFLHTVVAEKSVLSEVKYLTVLRKAHFSVCVVDKYQQRMMRFERKSTKNNPFTVGMTLRLTVTSFTIRTKKVCKLTLEERH